MFKQCKNKLSLKYNPLHALRFQEELMLRYHAAAIALNSKYSNYDFIVCYKIIADLVGKSNNWSSENITKDTMAHQYLVTFLGHIFGILLKNGKIMNFLDTYVTYFNMFRENYMLEACKI